MLLVAALSVLGCAGAAPVTPTPFLPTASHLQCADDTEETHRSTLPRTEAESLEVLRQTAVDPPTAVAVRHRRAAFAHITHLGGTDAQLVLDTMIAWLDWSWCRLRSQAESQFDPLTNDVLLAVWESHELLRRASSTEGPLAAERTWVEAHARSAFVPPCEMTDEIQFWNAALEWLTQLSIGETTIQIAGDAPMACLGITTLGGPLVPVRATLPHELGMEIGPSISVDEYASGFVDGRFEPPLADAPVALLRYRFTTVHGGGSGVLVLQRVDGWWRVVRQDERVTY